MVNVLVAGENTTHVGQQRMDEKESMRGEREVREKRALCRGMTELFLVVKEIQLSQPDRARSSARVGGARARRTTVPRMPLVNCC